MISAWGAANGRDLHVTDAIAINGQDLIQVNYSIGKS